MDHFACGLCVTNEGRPQAGDIERSRVIAGAIPETGGIGAAEPGSPVVDRFAMRGGCEGVSRAATAWAHMRGVARLLPFQTDTCQKAFVAKASPEVPAHLRVIAPIAPAPFCITPAPGGFHRLKRLPCDQLAVESRSQDQQDIGRQMREVVVSGLIFPPTSADLSAQDGKGFFGGGASWITYGEAIPLFFQGSHFCFELVNLAAQASLPSIKWARIQEKGVADLVAVEIDHTSRDQDSDAPIEAEHCLALLKGGRLVHRNLDDKIQHCVANAIGLDDFPQRGSERMPGFRSLNHEVRQLHLNSLLAPMPCPCSLHVGSAQGQRETLLIEIIAHAVGLAHLWPVISRIEQDACFEDRNGLHFFVGVRETTVLQVKSARLLDQAS